MKLHEYQAKKILKQTGIPVPEGQVAATTAQLENTVSKIPGPPWVVKAQVHTGGRGKGGGVRVVRSTPEVISAAETMFKNPLVTPQTGAQGVRVRRVLIEQGIDIEREFYLGMVIDRNTKMPTLIFSQAGGMEIEEVAAQSPELIWKEGASPITGWMPYQAGKLIYRLSPLPQPKVRKSIMSVMAAVWNVFMENDCSLLEINPLVVTREGRVMAADAKMTIDDNALFRQKKLAALNDPEEKDELEREAEDFGLSYIRLNGNIGAMVNGAGLAMATMDVIKAAGAEPANFLDVGGGASEEKIAKGFEIILRDPRVKAILINIFGGILRCDVLAKGVLAGAMKNRIQVPLIVRMAGTNEKEGTSILENSDLRFLVAKDLAEAADQVAAQV